MNGGSFLRAGEGFSTVDARPGIPPKLFTPAGDLVAVHMFKQGQSEGGILIPDTASAGWEACKGVVIAVGPRVPSSARIKEGDRILCFPSTMVKKLRLMGYDYLLVSWSELAGVEDEDAIRAEAERQKRERDSTEFNGEG